MNSSSIITIELNQLKLELELNEKEVHHESIQLDVK